MKLILLFTTSKIVILVLIFVNKIMCDEDRSHYTCARYGKTCDPYRRRPCCYASDVCGLVNKSYICYTKKELGQSCEYNKECSSVNHAECSKKKTCSCELHYTPVNKTACGPLLGELCRQNDECVPDNSVCIDSVCRCSLGFVKNNKRQCIPTVLGKACNNNSDCELVKFSVCSDNICVCASSTAVMSGSYCLQLLNLPCKSNEECQVDNSICIDNKCQCRLNYVKRGSKCVPKYLNEPCEGHSDCFEIRFAMCLADRCTCRNNYIATNETNCAPQLGGYCSEKYQCYVNNSECIDRNCQCKDHYYGNANNQCIPTRLGRTCKSNSDCNGIKNSKCSKNKVCACKENYTTLNDDACVPVANGFCLDDEQCVFEGFHCVDNKCQCKPDFILVSKHQCIKTTNVLSCIGNSECSDPWHAKCSDNKCVCTPNHFAINYFTCYPILGGYCWNDHQCITDNSECSDYHCQCRTNYVAISDNSCAHK